MTHRRPPAPTSDVRALVRVRARTRRLLGMRLWEPFFWGCLTQDERRRLVAYGLFAMRQEYARLGLLSEWREWMEGTSVKWDQR
jgi:hypothetical protein